MTVAVPNGARGNNRESSNGRAGHGALRAACTRLSVRLLLRLSHPRPIPNSLREVWTRAPAVGCSLLDCERRLCCVLRTICVMLRACEQIHFLIQRLATAIWRRPLLWLAKRWPPLGDPQRMSPRLQTRTPHLVRQRCHAAQGGLILPSILLSLWGGRSPRMPPLTCDWRCPRL